MTDVSPKSTRLTTLLCKLRDSLIETLHSLQQDSSGSKLPDVKADIDDINVAADYLRDIGFAHDGQRLQDEFSRLRNRCMDEWFAAMADGQSQEYREWLTELFGSFPSQGKPEDSLVADRRIAIVGFAAQLLKYVEELIDSVEKYAKLSTKVDFDPFEEALLETCHCLKGQQLKLFEFLVRRRHKTNYDTLQEHCWDKPVLETSIQTALERLAKSLNEMEPQRFSVVNEFSNLRVCVEPLFATTKPAVEISTNKPTKL